VIHLLSYSIPIIAVEVSLLSVNDTKSLHFTKLLNTYEEVDDGTSLDTRNYNRDYWVQKAKWTLDAAVTLLEQTSSVIKTAVMTYAKGYIAITIDGSTYMRLYKRSANKSLLEFRIEDALQINVAELLDANAITYTRKPRKFMITVDTNIIEKYSAIFISVARSFVRSEKSPAQ
jgi:hypothetical protein